jgi:peptidoglycan/xylan/chitin deacetylase (PgdA/CDA1 family)
LQASSSRIYRSRREVVTRILEFDGGRPGALRGGIILMHLNTHRQTDRPHEALPHLLKSLQDQGYRLVTVSELLARATPRHAVVASSATPRSSARVQRLTR